MDKHFLMVFFLCCFIVAATSLKCMTCHLRTRTDRCRRGFGFCVAQKFESCMTLKIFQGNILQLSYMVCQKFCRDLTFDLNNRTYVHKCCKHNFCNLKI
uniref:Prostate and testis expressed 3 n=1 Tax=Ailuropoda melanoleuca TaxID=9646 RepID=A0A7N5K631_AILME